MLQTDDKVKESGTMTKEQAEKYIEKLTYDEKEQLNELLKALERKRQPSPTLQVSANTSAQ